LNWIKALTTFGIQKSAAIAHVQAFLEVSKQEPGIWALAQGERSFLFDQGFASNVRSTLIELYRAIPVPDKDVPLEDILEFRTKRRDELLRLRTTIDDFYAEVVGSSDRDYELRRRVSEIEKSCIDLLRLCMNSKNPFRLSDWKISFSLSPGVGTALGGLIGQSFGLTEIGAFLGGLAGASLKISNDWKLGGVSEQNSPYWYVASFHRELF
jgi:uncharacterized protein DUF6236